MEEKEEIIEGLKAQIHRLEVDNQLLRRNEEKINSIMIEFIATRSKQISRHVQWLKEEEDDKAFLTRIKSTLMCNDDDAENADDEIQVIKVYPFNSSRGTKRRRLIDDTLSSRNTENDENPPTNELNKEQLEIQQTDNKDFEEILHAHRQSKAKPQTSKPKPPSIGIDIESSIYVKIEPSSSSDNDNTDNEQDEKDDEENEEEEEQQPIDDAEADEPMPTNDNDQEEDEEVEETDGEEESPQDKNNDGSIKTKYIHSGLTFTSRSKALQHLNKQCRWIKYRIITSKTGSTTKMLYNCKYDILCPVRSKVVVTHLPNNKQQVDLYLSKETGHVHNSSKDPNKYMLSDDQRQYIQNAIDDRDGAVSISAIKKGMKRANLIQNSDSHVLYMYIRNALAKKTNLGK